MYIQCFNVHLLIAPLQFGRKTYGTEEKNGGVCITVKRVGSLVTEYQTTFTLSQQLSEGQ